ncbi:MAG: hypothetical protein AB7S90_08215 [Marinobacterium sp.]
MKKLTLILSACLMSMPTMADKPSWAGPDGKPQKEWPERVHQPQQRDERYERRSNDRIDGFLPLSERERRLLRDLVLEERYGVRSEPGRMKSLPPGLQKKLARGGELPPGWRDKVRQGEVLDSDLYRRGERLPRHYLERLGYDSEAAELILLGDSVVRVAQGRGTVLDIIDLTDKALEMLGR